MQEDKAKRCAKRQPDSDDERPKSGRDIIDLVGLEATARLRARILAASWPMLMRHQPLPVRPIPGLAWTSTSHDFEIEECNNDFKMCCTGI
jgi:hypothetical protein